MYSPSVGIVVRNKEGNLWVGARFDMPGMVWQFPQGSIDEGETPAQAAARELFEETGIKSCDFVAQTEQWLRYDYPPDIRVRDRVSGDTLRGKDQKWFLHDFHGDDQEIVIDREPQEFKAWKWMPAQEIVSLMVPFKRPVIEEVLRIFRLTK